MHIRRLLSQYRYPMPITHHLAESLTTPSEKQWRRRTVQAHFLPHFQTLMYAHRRVLLRDSMLQSVQAVYICLMVVRHSLQSHRQWLPSFR